jgi:hypothetical protein
LNKHVQQVIKMVDQPLVLVQEYMYQQRQVILILLLYLILDHDLQVHIMQNLV